MQHIIIRPTGAEETPDPRLAGPDAGPFAESELFAKDGEPAPPANKTVGEAEPEADEEGCSLVVVGYPVYLKVEHVENYFKNMVTLRKAAVRQPGERVLVVFNSKKDLEFVWEWFGENKVTSVEGYVVRVERVKPPVEEGKAEGKAEGDKTDEVEAVK